MKTHLDSIYPNTIRQWVIFIARTFKKRFNIVIVQNKKYKGHWKIISLANTTKIYKSGTWAKYIKRLCQLYFLNKTLLQPSQGLPNRTDIFGLNGQVWNLNKIPDICKISFRSSFLSRIQPFSSEEVIYQSCFLKSKKSQESEITILHFIFDQSIFISFTHYFILK